MQSLNGFKIVNKFFSPNNCFERVHLLQKRHKTIKKKWAFNRNPKAPKDRALEYFDTYYPFVYKDLWPSIRISLLSQQKHCALVNNFSATDDIVLDLISNGADDMVKIAAITQIKPSNSVEYSEPSNSVEYSDEIYKQEISEKPVKDIHEVDFDHTSNNSDTDDRPVSGLDQLQSGKSESAERTDIHYFVPTKPVYTPQQLLQQQEFGQFSLDDQQVEVKKVKGQSISMPMHLKAHVFERGDVSVFPPSKADSAGSLDYYLMDASSILPVIALDLRPDDRVLDICAAPGGKTLAILQTMLPGHITCSDRSHSRITRLKHVLNSYAPKSYTSDGTVDILHQDSTILSRDLSSDQFYDKVLVDVPCNTDRHVLFVEDNNLFKPSRKEERLHLPEIQKQLLVSGIQCCKPGGSIVYSTCTLTPSQNDGVIQAAIDYIWHNSNINVVVEDISDISQRFKKVMNFYDSCRFGQLVLPTLTANFGPMYFCKLHRKS